MYKPLVPIALLLASCSKAQPPPPLYAEVPPDAAIPAPPVTAGQWNDRAAETSPYLCTEAVQAARHNSNFLRRVAYAKANLEHANLIGPERHSVLLMPSGDRLDVYFYLAERTFTQDWDVANVGLVPVTVDRKTGKIVAMGDRELAEFRRVSKAEQTLKAQPSNCAFGYHSQSYGSGVWKGTVNPTTNVYSW